MDRPTVGVSEEVAARPLYALAPKVPLDVYLEAKQRFDWGETLPQDEVTLSHAVSRGVESTLRENVEEL